MNSTTPVVESSRIEIESGAAVSVQVRAGAIISIVRGRVWLTQEGDVRDHCVCAGVTFCADRKGRVVLSALDETSVALVRHYVKLARSRMAPGTLRIDSMDQIARAARAARNAAVARAFAAFLNRLGSALRRLVAPRRHVTSPPAPPAPTAPSERFRGAVQSLR